MTTPQAAPADEAKRLVDEFGKAAIRCAKSATSANFDALVNAETRLNVEIDRLAALATQADTERANWKRWCEQAEAATQAEAPAAPAQGQKVEAWLKYFPGQARPEVMPAQTFLAEDAIAMGWRPLVFEAALAATPAQLAAPVKIHTEALRLSDELLMPYASDFHKVCEEASLTLRWLSLELAKEVSAREAAQGHLEALRAKQPAPVVQPLTKPVARIIECGEVDDAGRPLHARDIDFFHSDIERLPVGTKLYALQSQQESCSHD